MYILIISNGIKIKIKIKKSQLLGLFAVSLALWPLIEVYRTMAVSGVAAELALEAADYNQQNIIIFSIQRLFQRLLGFLQLSGLLVDISYQHSLDLVLSYDSISRYYTQSYLHLMQHGHLSSPSLLGTAFILAGDYWAGILVGFILFTFVVWKLALVLPTMTIPIRCMLGVGLFNTIMAGTIDFYLFDILLLYLFAFLIHFLFHFCLVRNINRVKYK